MPPSRSVTIVVAKSVMLRCVPEECSQPRPPTPPHRPIVRRSPSIVDHAEPSAPPSGWHAAHAAWRVPDRVGYFTGDDDVNSTLPRRMTGSIGSAPSAIWPSSVTGGTAGTLGDVERVSNANVRIAGALAAGRARIEAVRRDHPARAARRRRTRRDRARRHERSSSRTRRRPCAPSGENTRPIGFEPESSHRLVVGLARVAGSNTIELVGHVPRRTGFAPAARQCSR